MRRGVLAKRFEDGSRASIGDQYVEQACKRLDAACLAEANMFLPHFTADEIAPMIFRDEDLAALRAVHGKIAFEVGHFQYSLAPHADCTLGLRFDMPAPARSILHWQNARAAPLFNTVQEARELVIKWNNVKWLLRWFNRNATIGAVRANWPSVLQLCPDSPAVAKLDGSPTRYTNPQGLTPLLPLIRSTATTAATMEMIPHDAGPRQHATAWLIFSRKVGTDHAVDDITINL